MSNPIAEANQQQELPVVIVGAGMVGIATAIWTQRHGKSVILIDKGAEEGDRASFGNAGVLASSSVLPVTMPGILKKLPKMVLSNSEPLFIRIPHLPRLIPWAVRYLTHANVKDVQRIANALHPIIGNSLEDHLSLSEGTDAQQYIRACDFAFLYQNENLFKGDALAWNIRKDLGFTWSEHDTSQRHEYDPIFTSKFSFLAALSGHGQITDPGAYLKTLREHFHKSGGTLINGEVKDILHSQGRVSGVITSDREIAAQSVVITAGAHSPLLTRKLGIKIPVEAESGYHLEFWNPSLTPRSPTLVPSKKLIFTPMQGRLRVAGAVEFGGLNNKGQEKAFDNLKRAVDDVLPDLQYETVTRWLGHRPAPTDSIPIIDEIEHVKGLFLGFGHQHVGLTGSARTGQILSQLVCGLRPDIDLQPYTANRFIDTQNDACRVSHEAQQ